VRLVESEELPGQKQAIPDLIDLGAYFTHSLTEGGLNGLPEGVHAYAKAAFDVRGVIRLGGEVTSAAVGSLEGISIGRKGEKLDFLHGAVGHADEDAVIGRYVLHYSDGGTRAIPLVYGRNIKNSFDDGPSPVLTDAVVAWADTGEQVFKYTAFNPRPDVAIDTMDFICGSTPAVPFLIAVTMEPAQADRSYEWFDSIKAWNPIAPRSSDATPDQVDLTRFYGTSLNDDWFNHPGHDFHDVPQGLQVFGGVLFDVRGLIVLAGTRSLTVSGLALPEAVKRIPVGRMGKALHFLQASAFGACSDGSSAGAKLGEYVLHYVNGETRTADLVYQKNVLDWWVDPSEGHVTDAREVWYGANTATRGKGMRTRLVLYTWENPLPDVEIASLDFISAMTNSAPMLVAVSVEPDRRNRTSSTHLERKEPMSRQAAKIQPAIHPSPNVLVSCRGIHGEENALVVAYCCNCSYDPPMVMVGIVPSRYSHALVKTSGCFVVNLPAKKNRALFDYLGSHSGRDGDKLKAIGARTSNGWKVDAPLLDDCPISIECTVVGSIESGSHEMFIGRIEHIHADSMLLNDQGEIDFPSADLL